MDLISLILAKKYTNTELTTKADKITIATTLPAAVGGVTTLAANTEYYIADTQTTLNIAFSDNADAGDYCYLNFSTGDSPTIEFTGSVVGDANITLESGLVYDILALYDGYNWAISYTSYTYLEG